MDSLLESEGLDLNATGFPGKRALALAIRDGDEGSRKCYSIGMEHSG